MDVCTTADREPDIYSESWTEITRRQIKDRKKLWDTHRNSKSSGWKKLVAIVN